MGTYFTPACTTVSVSPGAAPLRRIALNGWPRDVALLGALVGAVIQVNVGATKFPFDTGNGSVSETSTVPDPVFAYETLNGVRY
jgi:hypothetical protein